MGNSSRRYLSLPRVGILILLCGSLYSLYYFTRTRWYPSSGAPDEDEGEDVEVSDAMAKRIQEIEKARADEEAYQRDFQRSLSPNDTTELMMGGKRYKIYKDRRVQFKRAIKLCKKAGGMIVSLEKAENKRKLQSLIEKNLGKPQKPEYFDPHHRDKNACWVGMSEEELKAKEEKKRKKMEKKLKKMKKKKKKKKEGEDGETGVQEEGGSGEGGGEDQEEGSEDYPYMDPMMMGGYGGGGGQGEEMCPALGAGDLYAPSPCAGRQPFLCEFPKGVVPKPLPKEKKSKKDRWRSRDPEEEYQDEL